TTNSPMSDRSYRWRPDALRRRYGLTMPTRADRSHRFAIGFDQLAVALLATAVTAVLCRATFQNDTWWALRVGQDLVRDHVWPCHDHFTYTARGAHFPDHEWLTDALFYVLDDVFGNIGPSVLAVACSVGALTIVWKRLTGPWGRRMVLAAVAVDVVA